MQLVKAGANAEWKLYYLHINFGIGQLVQGFFAVWVPYLHLKELDQERKVLDQERTNDLVQDQEQEIPATEYNVRQEKYRLRMHCT